MSSTEHSTSTDFASIDQFEAARTGNLAWFQHHKAAGTLPDLMLADTDGYYSHEFAAEHGHLPVVRYLIEDSGQSVDATARDNRALRYAAANGHLSVVRYFIEDSGQSDDVTVHSNFALRYAAANGHLSVIRYLIEDSGQSVDATTNYNYAIRLAACNGHLSVVRYLIEESGQPINITAWDNGALKFATENDHTDVIQYLETVIPIIESLGLDLAREFFKSQLSITSKNTDASSVKGRI
jgi:ankyrin repeat protein